MTSWEVLLGAENASFGGANIERERGGEGTEGQRRQAFLAGETPSFKTELRMFLPRFAFGTFDRRGETTLKGLDKIAQGKPCEPPANKAPPWVSIQRTHPSFEPRFWRRSRQNRGSKGRSAGHASTQGGSQLAVARFVSPGLSCLTASPYPATNMLNGVDRGAELRHIAGRNGSGIGFQPVRLLQF